MSPPEWLPAWVAAGFKFGLKGVGGLLANLTLLTILVDIAGLPPQWAIFGAWAMLVIPHYLVTERLVFSAFKSPTTTLQHGQRGAMFYGVMWSGKGLNYAIYLALLEVGVLYQLAWAAGSIMAFPWTFGANYWLWKTNPDGWRDVIAHARHQLFGKPQT